MGAAVLTHSSLLLDQEKNALKSRGSVMAQMSQTTVYYILDYMQVQAVR